MNKIHLKWTKQRKIFQIIAGNIVNYFINGYKYGFRLGADSQAKSFRYVSFAANNFDSQDYYYECAVHSPETNNMDSWTDTEWVGTWQLVLASYDD